MRQLKNPGAPFELTTEKKKEVASALFPKRTETLPERHAGDAPNEFTAEDLMEASRKN